MSVASLTPAVAHAASLEVTLQTTNDSGGQGALGLFASASVNTQFSALTGYVYDFGDGTSLSCGQDDESSDNCRMSASESASELDAYHYYAKPGVYHVQITVTGADGETIVGSSTFATVGSDYTAYGPTRILDTRNGTGVSKAAPVAPGGTVKLKIAGQGSIPSGVTAVALNVTVTDSTRNGYVAVYPDGSPRPNVSNLNYGPGQTLANSVIVPVTDGYVDLTDSSSGTAELVADVTGYFSQAAGSGYTPLTPGRILDTRNGTGGTSGPLEAGRSLPVTVAGADGGLLPASGISAVALNVTVADATGAGYLTVYPDGESTPNTSSLNFRAGDARSAEVIVPVGADGKIDIADGGPVGGTQVIADVDGYFSAAGTNAYVPIAPTRMLDTRQPTGEYGQCVLLDADQIPGHPVDVTALILNLTVTETSSAGWLAQVPANETTSASPANYGCTGLDPKTSNVNWTGAGATVSNLDLADPALDGQMAFYFSDADGVAPQLVIDAFGYFGADELPGTL